MQYETFRATAYKNKYEIAIETETERISYGDLLKTVLAFYNSLCQMSLCGKTVAVFTGASSKTVAAVFGALKADCKCVIMSPSGNLERINKSLSVYRPDVAVVYSQHLNQLAPSLVAFGTSCAVTIGDGIPEQQYLPSVYSFDELVEINDYAIQSADGKNGQLVFESELAVFEHADAIKSLGKRDGVLFDLPLYTSASYYALEKVFENGKKCVFLTTPDKKTIKKKKVKLAIVGNTKNQLDCNTVAVSSDDVFAIQNQLLYVKDTEQYISERCGYPIKLSYDGSKLKVYVELGADADILSVSSSPLAQALSDICKDAFFAINCTKSIIFKKQFDYNN